MPGDVEAILVAGMHRSGTSSLAGTLVKMGATAPRTLMGASEGNERGHWESWAVMELNDEILAAVGSSWSDWHPIREFWDDEGFMARFRDRARAMLDTEFDHSTFYVFKDPRLCRILPFWIRVLGESGAIFRVLLPVRNPLEVAYSLRKRSGFSLSLGLLLWLTHTLDAEAYSRGSARAVVDWTDFLSDSRLTLARAGEHLGRAWPYQSIKNRSEMEDFLTEDLRHNVVSDADFEIHPDINHWIKRTYRAMQQLAREPHSEDALHTLQDVRVEFHRAAELFGPILLKLEKQEEERAEAYRILQDKERAAETRSALLGGEVGQQTERAALAEQEREHLRHLLGQTEVERSDLAQQVEASATERDRLCAERDRVAAEKEQLEAERNRAAAEKEQLTAERDRVAAEKEQLEAERNRAAAEKEQLTAERDLVAAEKEQLEAERDRSTAEREQLADELKCRVEELRAMKQDIERVNEAFERANSQGMLRRLIGSRHS
ncbi:hypothetical protein LGH83_10760 [Lichenihabitans sp. PAMC28606]|uniref:hypothetical protein n=1 Tax=Lichenihabitans sp. PAMC28606 TaxID=2880932 RepID=UPI001D09B6F4|nr:hypothetical protein [Lichenihabitans sp. PAMC28606]UDL93107.1 hypothetical protein LGH83_10760 [Lichenihabitans sp. PAMC28606]